MAETKNILIIGRSGRGKSTLANVIIGAKNKFKESSGSASETRNIQYEQFTDQENNINYLVIDTPGIGDTKLRDDQVLDIIAEAVYLVRDGVNQVFFVIDKRFDQAEMATYNLLRTIIFDAAITNYTTIIRTRFEEFDDEERCQEDVSTAINEAKEKKNKLHDDIVKKERRLTELVTDKHKELFEQIEKAKKELSTTNLAEIIESCQSRVVHVNNPPLDIEDEEELELNKEDRRLSRKKLLEHLQNSCQEIYKPKKLEELSDDIANDMDLLLQNRRELDAELKKIKVKEKNNNSIISEVSNAINALESDKQNFFASDDSDDENQENFATSNELTKNNEIGIGEKIAQLESRKEQLEKEISAKEKTIRQKVLKHIFNNYDNINNELGGEIFLQSVVGDHDWHSINQKFADKEIIIKWLSKEFDYEQVQKWATALGSSFNPEYDAGFCAWLRDDMKLTVEKIELLTHVSNIEQLRKEYAHQLFKETMVLERHNSQQLVLNEKQNWESIHPDFVGYLGEEKKEKWLEAGLNFQQTKHWINSGLKTSESEIANYAIWKGYELSVINASELRKEYYKVQNWLDYYYPLEGEARLYPNQYKKRSEIKSLNISNKNLEGSLISLEGFVNLEKFYCCDNKLTNLKLNFLNSLQIINCARNQLTSLDLKNLKKLASLECSANFLTSTEFLTNLSHPQKLEELCISNNSFIPQDLSFLSNFINLRGLDVSRNKFYGSLKLESMGKLETLDINETYVSNNWETKPTSLKHFYHSVAANNHEELEKYWIGLQEEEKKWESKIEVTDFKI